VAAEPDRSGILGYHMQLSDDGKFALVEYVFATPVTFRAAMQQEAAARGLTINAAATRPATAAGFAAATPEQIGLEAAVPGLKIFERGKATESDILNEFQKHKKNFAFGTAMARPQ